MINNLKTAEKCLKESKTAIKTLKALNIGLLLSLSFLVLLLYVSILNLATGIMLGFILIAITNKISKKQLNKIIHFEMVIDEIKKQTFIDKKINVYKNPYLESNEPELKNIYDTYY